MKDNLDRRYKATRIYLETGEGEPVYKQRAFSHINNVLRRGWYTKSPEEYFSNDQIKEAKEAMRILSFTGEESIREVRKQYIKLSQGSSKDNKPGWHPDTGGHDRAFDILNHAYKIFKEAV